MKAGFEKYMLIASELIAYCHLHGAREYHLDIKETASETNFKVAASPIVLNHDELESLKMKLNAPRHREVEQEFWDVMGESETECELTLMGMLCDETEAELNGNELIIKLKRLA
jgi:hypothetical protein